jgi:transcriptional regulator with XRE-family HTH domain
MLCKGGKVMKFNYSKLLGKMKECGFTQAQLAEAIGINRATLSAKLNNHFSFDQEEILAICKLLNIPASEISDYFYAV